MTYKDFFQTIRDNLKDADTEATASIPSAELGRATLRGVRKLQTTFPEIRLDRRGRQAAIETASYTEATAAVKVDGAYPVIPVTEEFEPALEAYVMAWAYGRDSNDAKDESLFRYWQGCYDQLTGNVAPRR